MYINLNKLKDFFVCRNDIQDNLISTDTNKPLSAYQGKLLDSNKEDKSNKVTHLSINSTDTEYPSAKAVYDTLDGYNSGLSNTYQTKKVGSGEAYENKNVVTDSSGNITIENKPTIPSKTSDLINDSNFLISHQDISGKEDASNKSSSITSDTGSTTKYPTVKAVEDYAQPIGNYLTSHQDLSNYVQKSQTNGLIKNDGTIDPTTYLSSLPSHTHGNLQNDGSVGTSNNASKNVVTDSNGQITIEDKPTIPYASSTKPSADTTNGSVGIGTTWAKADHTHPKSTIYAESSHNHTTLSSVTSILGLFTNQQQKIIFYRANQGQWNFIDNKISYDGTNITYNSSEIATIDDIPTLLSDLTNDSSFIETSDTIGLIKNDGTIDTNTYLTAHQTLPTIADNLTTNDATQVLSAKQGKILNDLIGDAITYINQ